MYVNGNHMHTKLTLRIQKDLIKSAKKYSKNHGKSLSQLVADYLFLITQTALANNQIKEDLLPLTSSLKGILRGKKINETDYKKYLEDKHQ